MWKQWVNVILGILIVILAYSVARPFWTVLFAIIIIVLSLWSGVEGAPRR